MAQDGVIARRYARGLAEYAVEQGGIDDVRRDLRLVADLLDPRSGDRYVPDFAAYLDSPLKNAEDKRKTASDLLSRAGVGEAVTNFLCLLIEKGRVKLLPKIAAAFFHEAGELTGDRSALVRTARPLTPDQEQRLGKVLSNLFGGEVHIRQQIEPNLLAGAQVTVGDRTFDGTVLGRLETMRRNLASETFFHHALARSGKEE